LILNEDILVYCKKQPKDLKNIGCSKIPPNLIWHKIQV